MRENRPKQNIGKRMNILSDGKSCPIKKKVKWKCGKFDSWLIENILIYAPQIELHKMQIDFINI